VAINAPTDVDLEVLPDAPLSGAATARERVVALLARVIARIPPAVVRRLAGPPVAVDGQTLEPEAQLAQRLLDLRGRKDLTVAERRAKAERDARIFVGPRIDVPEARDLEVAAGTLRSRLYAGRATPHPSPLLVYYHGGGWTTGSLETHDNLCRFLANEARLRVLSVDYRLAPEHPFPAAVDDALATFRDAAERADELGAEAGRVAVGGDSAGANLAAVCAQLARDGGPMPALQLLVYPVVQIGDRSHRSYELFGEGYYLSQADMDFYDQCYLLDAAQAADPRASPLRADDMSGLPPALIVIAGFDPLRDEGLEYAERLAAGGVRVRVERVDGLPHGFANVVAAGRAAPAAMRRVTAALREMLAEPEGTP
jgi:acetyl esterase